MGIFCAHAHEYLDAGLVAFPVDPRAKKPLVKHWMKAGVPAGRAWSSGHRFDGANGIGIRMGKIVEVDVDAAGSAWLQAAVERFGDTSIKIRTASGKSKLWFRSNGEGRHIRPFPGMPIDILGDGFTIAPPSWREDLGAAYRFLSGSPANLNDLPPIRCGALEPQAQAQDVVAGERNASLWRWCMTQARACDDAESLIEVAETWASAFPDPLPAVEVRRCAMSAWKYEANGRNYFGLKKPQITEQDKIMDDLIDVPEAFALFQLLVRWHKDRPDFAIAPRAMSDAGNPPWPRRRIAGARDVLLERGFLIEVAEPSKAQRKSGRYRLAAGLPGFGHNHYTPPSPPLGQRDGCSA